MKRAILAAVLVLLLAASTVERSDAYYGGQRFYGSQPQIMTRLLHNVPGDDFLVSAYGGTFFQKVAVSQAVNNWSTALQSAPNSLTKYPLHFNTFDDPNANIRVNIVTDEDLDEHCRDNPAIFGCNDLGYSTTNIWMDEGSTTARNVAHELGHSLRFDEQYYADFHCANGQTEGEPPHSHANYASVMDCDNITESTDEYDFRNRSNPTYSNPNPMYPHTWGSTWSALYQIGEVTVFLPSSLVEWKTQWLRWTDTYGSPFGSPPDSYIGAVLDPSPPNPTVNFSYVLGSRYCITGKIYNEVGWTGTQPWSPASQHSCIGAAQSQAAGFLLATSDRADSTSNWLYLRIKNFTGGSRNVGIFGLAGGSFYDIGCG